MELNLLQTLSGDGLEYLALYADDSIILASQSADQRIAAITFDGVSFSKVATSQVLSADSSAYRMVSNGSDIFYVNNNGTKILQKLNWDGQSISFVSQTVIVVSQIYSMYVDDAYLYLGLYDYTTIVVYDLNLGLVGAVGSDTVRAIHGDGQYIYAGHSSSPRQLRAYAWGANMLQPVGNPYDIGDSEVRGIFCRNGYIFIANDTDGVKVFTFDGTDFALVASDASPRNAFGVWANQNNNLFVAGGNNNSVNGGEHYYSFDGATLTWLDSYRSGADASYQVTGNSQYAFARSSVVNNYIRAYFSAEPVVVMPKHYSAMRKVFPCLA